MRKIHTIQQKQVVLSAGVVALFIAIAILSMSFVKLASEVRENDTNQFDDGVLVGIHSITSPFLDQFVPVLTNIGGFVVVSGVTAILLGLFVYKKEYYRAAHIALCMSGAIALNLILKSVFERASPDLWDKIVHESSYSFPSGHAMMSAAFGFALIVALWNSRWRWWAVWFSAIYIPVVGFTRLYLGVHYPTDVLAGWLVSGAWVMMVTLLLRSKFAHQALKKLS
jgi:undecaprenyl-diphosphatase